MKTNYIFAFILGILCLGVVNSQSISEPGKLGLGLASSYPGYGLSAKYNFTETHTAQLILGTASYGFGTSSLAVSGRYLYNFEAGGDTFVYKPYAYGQLGYFSVKVDFLGQSDSASTVSFGVGGGVECSVPDFVDGLAFNVDIGYVGGSFDNGLGGFSGLAWGLGVHYYFDI